MRFPGPDTDPRETMEYVRRWELITGVVSIALGLILWNAGWWHWVLISLGVYGLLPWGGARTILRKAEKNPDVLIWDPERRRARGRRIAIFQTPIWTLFGGVVGYVMDGWPYAIALATLFAVSAGIASWWALRRNRPR